MKIKSALLTQASGSVGGFTASRNRGGMYLRSRVVPVNPNTVAQGAARANLASATNTWTNTLTDTQRQGWASYAANTPTTDKLGDTLILTGQQMFVKSTLPRLIAGLPTVPAAPTTSGLATPVSVPLDTPGVIDVSVGFNATARVEGAGSTGNVAIYMSEPTPASRSLSHAKRRFAGISDAPTADVFTLVISTADLPYPPVPDLRTRITYVFLDPDGRVSAEAFEDITIVA